MVIFDLFLKPMQATVGLLNSIIILDVPLSAYIVGAIIILLILNFLRGGSND